MDECFRCGVSENKAHLFDAILNEGIFKVCERCSFNEDIPIIKRPTTFQLKESEKQPLSFRDRVKEFELRKGVESELLKKQETTLRDIVDRNVKLKFKETSKSRVDLINNFHWIILRARRARKMTQVQLAKAIGESESAIRMVERGILPEDYHILINKLETFLGIRLVKNEIAEKIKQQPKRLDFDKYTTKILTISDLQDMKKRKTEKGSVDKERELSDEEENIKEERELSDGEIEDLIFGRK